MSVQGKFYPLQHDEWVQACKELSSGARDVLYYIRTADPYSNGVEIVAAAIALELSVNRSTVSRALKELDQKGYIELEIVKAKVSIIGKGLLAISERCENALPVAKMQHAVQNCNAECEIATPSAFLQQAQAETLAQQAFGEPKTYKDYLKTLSDQQRASFEYFCRKRIDGLGFKVGSPTGWLNKHWPDYWEEFSRTPEAKGCDRQFAAPALSETQQRQVEEAIESGRIVLDQNYQNGQIVTSVFEFRSDGRRDWFATIEEWLKIQEQNNETSSVC